MTKRFGRLEHGVLKYAPLQLKYNGILYAMPPDEVYIALQYKEIIDEKPSAGENEEVVFLGYGDEPTAIRAIYEIRQKEDVEEEHTESYEISKFYLRIALTKLGLWEQFTNWLSSFDIPIAEGITINALEAWKEALVLDIKNPMFAPYVESAKEMFSQYIDEAELMEILEQCKAK